MNADVTQIWENSLRVERITRAMVEAVSIVRTLRFFNEDGIIGVDNSGVHMTKDAFEAISWGVPVECEYHSSGWTRHYVFAYDVKVFCLVEATGDADQSV